MPLGLPPIEEAYLLTLSAPIKPGAVHRLSKGSEFETRLLEFIMVHDYAKNAYERGYLVGRGDLEARSLGTGRFISDALRRAFERTGMKPLTGLIASFITLAAIAGYHEGSQRYSSLEDALKKTVRILLYTSSSDDAVFLIEGVEAVGDSDLLILLENNGITKRKIAINNLSIGDIFEVLSEIDTGFFINLRKITLLTELINIAKRSNNIIAAVIETYLTLADKNNLIRLKDIISSKNPILELKKLDETINDRKTYNRLLGAVFTAIATVNYDKLLKLPQ